MFGIVAVIMLQLVFLIGMWNLRKDAVKLMKWKRVDWMSADDRMRHEELHRKLKRAFIVDLATALVGIFGTVAVWASWWIQSRGAS